MKKDSLRFIKLHSYMPMSFSSYPVQLLSELLKPNNIRAVFANTESSVGYARKALYYLWSDITRI
jgi:hypothetical protein